MADARKPAPCYAEVARDFRIAHAAALLDGLPLTPADESGNVFRPVAPRELP